MSLVTLESLAPSRLKALLDHFGGNRRSARALVGRPSAAGGAAPGGLRHDLRLRGHESIAEWGEAHLPILRRYLPYHHGVPGGRWVTILMNRMDPHLFAKAFTDLVRATWPQRPEFVAIDGKTSRRSHDRATGKPPLHLVSA